MSRRPAASRPAVARLRAGLGHMVQDRGGSGPAGAAGRSAGAGRGHASCWTTCRLEDLRRAVALAKGKAVLEASGNVTLATVRAIAETGVDYISSGAITHSAPNLDIGLDF